MKSQSLFFWRNIKKKISSIHLFSGEKYFKMLFFPATVKGKKKIMHLTNRNFDVKLLTIT